MWNPRPSRAAAHRSPRRGFALTALIDILSVLVPARRADIGRLHPLFSSEVELTTELVRRRWLTAFQGRWLLRGHGRRLLLDSYVLLDRLGEGGSGQVFLAAHRGLGRRAAIKVLRADRGTSRNARARFLREVRTLGRLNHLNVVHAYDAGFVGRSCYLAMEYAPGPDLGRLTAPGAPVPSGRACEYARQAALGLHHLHEHGLVHRDVKPGNLILAADERVVKLLDVGFAKDRAGDAGTALTQAGWLVGTPDYASPEQVLDSRRIGHRSDQYSLGCTLYHLLVGEAPFAGGTPVEKALRRVTERPRLVTERRPELSAGLAAVVARLLAPDPKDRFPSALAAAAALTPFAIPLAGSGDETVTDLVPQAPLPGPLRA